MVLKTEIKERLQAFSQGNLRDNALTLLNTLGYRSEKTLDLDKHCPPFLPSLTSVTGNSTRKKLCLSLDSPSNSYFRLRHWPGHVYYNLVSLVFIGIWPTTGEEERNGN